MSRVGEGALLAQFIEEARDLVEQAGQNLLALERAISADAINALFRAVHTLKGTSGLFDIVPLTRVMHASEDLLAAVQEGRQVLNADSTDVLLEALDQVRFWIEVLARDGRLPADAADVGDALEPRLRARLATPDRDASPADAARARAGVMPDWVASLPRSAVRRPEDGPLIAVSYAPDPHCFFRGEDPLALMRQIPELRTLGVESIEPWPGLAEIDPFHCNLRLRAVAAASPEDIAHLFRYVPDQVEVVPLPPDWSDRGAGIADAPDPSEGAALAALLEGQRRLLTGGDAESWSSRLAAAAAALEGALRWAGRAELLKALDAAVVQARTLVDPAPVLAFMAAWTGMPTPPRGSGATGMDAPAPPVHPGATGPTTSGASGPAAPAVLRVEQGKIDALMTLIGELVVAKNALAYLGRQAEQGSLGARELAREIKERHALFNRIAEDLQGAVMAVRMLPVDHIFQRFPRLVRDIARRLGKKVELLIEGAATEADKNVIESLADPLIHIVRNSLDHGLETPAERLAAGKSEHGTIRLHALQENDSVVIRIIDDGRGIDPALIRRKAVEKGLVDADRAAALGDAEAVNLIFAPGFSTAAEISDLSGRGVGMDVVRSAIEKVGGSVKLDSRVELGTTIELTLPLSMAVTRIMTVECGGRLFGVPIGVVMETVRVPRAAMHRIRDREAFVLRDSIIPVMRLSRLLELPEADVEGDRAEEAVLVVRLHGERLGIVVDAFRDGMEAIVRPMEGLLAGLQGFAGTTLLGDGRVLLVLDLRELVG